MRGHGVEFRLALVQLGLQLLFLQFALGLQFIFLRRLLGLRLLLGLFGLDRELRLHLLKLRLLLQLCSVLLGLHLQLLLLGLPCVVLRRRRGLHLRQRHLNGTAHASAPDRRHDDFFDRIARHHARRNRWPKPLYELRHAAHQLRNA